MIDSRLGAEDVESRTGDLARIEGGLQILVDDQRATRDIEDAHAVLHLGERRGIQPAFGLVVLGQMHRDEIGDRVELVRRRGALHPELAEPVGGQVHVEGDHAHTEPARAVGHELPDTTEADDAQRLLVQLHPVELGAIPRAPDQRGVRLRNIAGQREQQGHRVLGRRDDVRLGRVGYDHSAAGGRIDIDVVDADTGTGHDLQAVGLGQQVSIDLGGRADQDAVEVGDASLELGAIPRCAQLDLEPGGTQQLDSGIADLLRDENLPCRRRHDPVDAGGQRLDITRFDGGEHPDAQLVAAELAIGLDIDDPVGSQGFRDRCRIDGVGEVDRADDERALLRHADERRRELGRLGPPVQIDDALVRATQNCKPPPASIQSI